LEFFDFIRKEKIKSLIGHLVENYREKLVKITYVDIFRNFVLQYDQTLGFTLDPSLQDTEDDIPKQTETGRGSRWDNGIKDLDSAEEEYFNTSDDEEDNSSPGKSPSSRGSVNGASPLSKPLVDYNSDEDTENMDIDATLVITPSKNGASESPKSSSVGVSTPKSSGAPSERLSEKRRREEDEEDELGKLSHHKRRNSSSSVGSNTSSVLRRKKSFSTGVNGNVGNSGKPTKIAISMPAAVKTGGDSKGGQGNS